MRTMAGPLSRRQYLLGAGTVVAGASILAGVRETLGGFHRKLPYRSRRTAGIRTAEPIVRGTGVSADSTAPNSYATLVRTREGADQRYRVEYLQNVFDTDVSGLYEVDYDSEFVAIVGYVLPRDRHLALSGVEYDEGTLYTSHEITDSRGLTDRIVHHNVVIFRQQGHEPPAAIDADFRTG